MLPPRALCSLHAILTPLVSLALLCVALMPSEAQAFCGFYVSGADQEMYNNATMVVMMREGTKTVLSMRNNYEGPPEDFAMVIPVPQVLSEESVKVLKDDVFTRVDQLAAPRLVEYWEQDPCLVLAYKEERKGSGNFREMDVKSSSDSGGSFGVKVEAQFDVGEYNVVILSAKESNGLEKWLEQEKYNIPKGAAPVLKPYIEGGQYFFVAKVDPKKVTFKDGQARLSPLRFHYDSKEFSLPVRLGLLNAKGHQDLLVHILAKKQRYEVANYKNVTIPTNILVKDHVRDRFSEFYATLLDRTLEENPNAVITEYSWDASTCDPCPVPALESGELYTLGADVIDGGSPAKEELALDFQRPDIEDGKLRSVLHRLTLSHRGEILECYKKGLKEIPGIEDLTMNLEVTIDKDGKVSYGRVVDMSYEHGPIRMCIQDDMKSWSYPKSSRDIKFKQRLRMHKKQLIDLSSVNSRGWVLTRLHARYTKDDLEEDLVFKMADPIVGGRGTPSGENPKMAEEGAKPGGYNNFQGRYIMLNRWEGKVECENPRRGIWGGPPNGGQQTRAASDIAFAPRGKFELPTALAQKQVPGLELEGAPDKTPAEAAPETTTPSPPLEKPAADTSSASTPAKKKPASKSSNCATAPATPSDLPLEGLLLFGVFGLLRRWKKTRVSP
jgi:hypothetical protein